MSSCTDSSAGTAHPAAGNSASQQNHSRQLRAADHNCRGPEFISTPLRPTDGWEKLSALPAKSPSPCSTLRHAEPAFDRAALELTLVKLLSCFTNDTNSHSHSRNQYKSCLVGDTLKKKKKRKKGTEKALPHLITLRTHGKKHDCWKSHAAVGLKVTCPAATVQPTNRHVPTHFYLKFSDRLCCEDHN